MHHPSLTSRSSEKHHPPTIKNIRAHSVERPSITSSPSQFQGSRVHGPESRVPASCPTHVTRHTSHATGSKAHSSHEEASKTENRFPGFQVSRFPVSRFPGFQVSSFQASRFPGFQGSKFPGFRFPGFQVSSFQVSKFPQSQHVTRDTYK